MDVANMLQATPLQNVLHGNQHIRQLVRQGRLREAHHMLQDMASRDVYSWTALLSGYVNCGKADQALHLFCNMQEECVLPNNVTFICTLRACVAVSSLEWGRKMHAFITDIGLEVDVYVGSCLVDMYAKCGSIYDAEQVFRELPARNVVSWTALISGYVKGGLGTEAMELFRQMQQEKVAPNEVTVASNIAACGSIPSLGFGQEIHRYTACCGYDSDYVVGNALISMYIKCGDLECSRHCFDRLDKEDVVSWNTMIEGYAQHSKGGEAIQVFCLMIEKWVTPDKMTFLSCLKACAQTQDAENGKLVHDCMKSTGIEVDAILGSSLIDMFAKCGRIESARGVFKRLRERDVIAWTIMISALFQHGDMEGAFKLFDEMRCAGVQPDKLTYNNVINACARISDSERGKRVHKEMVTCGLRPDLAIGSSLVDMYSKCGELEKAWEVFAALPERDLITWNAMIVGYAQHGDFKGLRGLCDEMSKSRVELDKVTYLSFLSALNHWGLVDEGHCLMIFLIKGKDIKPTPEICNCMVDLLGRAGHLEGAKDFIRNMPFQPNAEDWILLLAACRLYHNVDVGGDAIGQVQELQPKNAAALVLFSNLFEEYDAQA